jgi:putative addiction module killer protein
MIEFGYENYLHHCFLQDTIPVKYTLRSTAEFNKWFARLKNQDSKRKILARFARVENGNFGDHKHIQGGLFELRFFFDGGWRIYYTIQNNQVVILLYGGNKSSQQKDITKAKQLLDELET